MNDDGLGLLPGEQPWELAGMMLRSRVMLGTTGYPSPQLMLDALEASGTTLVTMPIKQETADAQSAENLYDLVYTAGYSVLPTTAGCLTAEDAIITAELSRAALGTPLIKLEVVFDEQTQLPDTEGLLIAARELVERGFYVLPSTTDDPVVAQKLEDFGCAAILPLGAPVGSGLGIRNPYNIELITLRSKIPVVVDAGMGTASDVAIAFELGVEGVMLNSTVATARDPVRMARAVRAAAIAGREAFLAGRGSRRFDIEPSPPLEAPGGTSDLAWP